MWISTPVASLAILWQSYSTPAEKYTNLAGPEADGNIQRPILRCQSVWTMPSVGTTAGVGRWVKWKPNEPSPHSTRYKARAFNF